MREIAAASSFGFFWLAFCNANACANVDSQLNRYMFYVYTCVHVSNMPTPININITRPILYMMHMHTPVTTGPVMCGISMITAANALERQISKLCLSLAYPSTPPHTGHESQQCGVSHRRQPPERHRLDWAGPKRAASAPGRVVN